MPIEFERDTHYFMSTDLATDIEPAAETDNKEYNCKVGVTDGLKVCAQAFYIIQAHHDYCPHDTLTRYEEELFHEWEASCYVRSRRPDARARCAARAEGAHVRIPCSQTASSTHCSSHAG